MLKHFSEISLYDEFAEAAMLNAKYDPWVRRRDSIASHYKDGCILFGEFMLLPSAKNNWTWWYPFEGVIFLGLFPGLYGDQTSVEPCQIKGKTLIVRGPGIWKTDLILI